MESLLRTVVSNVGWAAALALGATVAGWLFRQRPTLAHGLWLLVLLKLVTPSLVQLPPNRAPGPAMIDPAAPWRAGDTPEAADIPGPAPEVVADGPDASEPRPPETRAARVERSGGRTWSWPWRTTMAGLWLAGAAAWWSTVVLQVSRFRRLLRAARPAPEPLRDRAGRLADRLGVRHGPTVWLLPARLPPMIWALTGPPRLILPADLWGRLDEDQQDTVLVHELAHLKRRDHWVRWLEAVILGLYWWNPVAWWARRRVEEAEEQCCDAWVVWALPNAAEAYAEALVATAVFLSGPRMPWTVGSTGVRRIPPLRRRLNMILRDPRSGMMARPASRALLIFGVLSLLLLPAPAPGRRPAASTRPGPEVPFGSAPARAVAALAGEQAVVVSQPLVREVSDSRDFTGQVEAAQTIEIRARVGGTLDKVYPQAEQVIEKGGLLFEIDPRPYQAEVEKAEAEVSRSEAQLKRWSAEWERAKTMHARGTIPENELERLEGERDVASASLQAARATLDIARLKLDSTKITAPIRGKVGRPRLAAGNLVIADTTVLATIDSSDPMYVAFNVDERTVLRLGRESREGKAKSALAAGLPVLVALADENGFPRRGQLDSVDTRFDPANATLRCRAVIANPDGFLLPGLFARVRLVTSAPARALLVSEGAVLSDQGRHALFVVSDQNVVERRTVVLGELHDGLQAVKEGLKEGEWVVVNGLEEVKAGMTVKPERAAMPTRSSTP